MDQRYLLKLVGITYNQIESGVYAVILEEPESHRRIPIIIGASEAQSIECRLQGITPPRPLTHDLLTTVLSRFGITLREVMLRRLPSGVFAADLLLTDNTGNQQVIDSRSSDAIALAIRTGSPIYTTAKVLAEAGFNTGEERLSATRGTVVTPKTSGINRPSELSHMDIDQLNKAMMKAAEDENYEEAARIKAEIDRRNNPNP